MNKTHGKKKSNKSSRSRSHSVFSGIYFEECDDFHDGPKYDIRVSKVMGRYMVANKNIKPGETILKEEPLVVGPCTGCQVQCLGCYKNLETGENFLRCKNCGWPLCSNNCPGLNKAHGHTEIECTILQESRSSSFFSYDDLRKMRIHFHAIVPLRCLILKTIDPSTYDLLMGMESHNEIRKSIPEVWNGNQANVVDRIIKDWGLTEFTEDEIHTICGILEVNAFEIGHAGINLRGLYPTAFLMSHDCVPNTNHTDDQKSYELTVRASTEIQEGYPVTLSYAYTLQNSLKRREHLLENKFFECGCRRCLDPTELGSHCGSLLCPKCPDGLVLCDTPADFESAWTCNNVAQGKCPGYQVSARSMKLLLARISQEIDQLEGSNDIKAMEMFLHKYRNVLHPTHYLCLGVKISLSQLYGKINGYLVHQLSEELLIRKRELCREILNIFDVIEPGYTRIRGVTLYEIHVPMMILLTRELENGGCLSKCDLKNQLKEVINYLLEARIILGYEPEDSPEGLMGKAARAALSRIKEWEKIVGKIR